MNLYINRINPTCLKEQERQTEICAVQVLEEFHNISIPELKGVKCIDEVLSRVDSLVLPFEEVSFNPFSISKMSSWKMIMQDFDTAVKVGLGHLNCFYKFNITIKCNFASI